jgi:hypothetical protein
VGIESGLNHIEASIGRVEIAQGPLVRRSVERLIVEYVRTSSDLHAAIAGGEPEEAIEDRRARLLSLRAKLVRVCAAGEV